MLHMDFTSQEYLRDPSARLAKLRASRPGGGGALPDRREDLDHDNQRAGRPCLERQRDLHDAQERHELPVCAGGCRAILAPSRSACSPWTNRTIRGCAALSTKPSVAAPFSTWKPRIFAIAEELAAELFVDGSPADLVERYARKLPLSVICELLGLPHADWPRFIAWANSLTRLSGMVSFLRMLAGIGPMKRYLEERLQVAREHGGEGLIAELVRVEKEGGRISGQEMVAMVFLLLGAGSETTTHLISGSVYELLKSPRIARLARGGLEPRGALAVEEFLRFVSPVQFTKPRFVTKGC